MKPTPPSEFKRNDPDAGNRPTVHERPVIRAQMNRGDWLILLVLAVIWGGAFFFIDVAVRNVPPLTYVWLRVTIAAIGMWVFVWLKRETLQLPRSAWGSMLVLALLNNTLPFALFGWSQTHIASGLASILNATTPIWGVVVAHFLTHDERMTPRRAAGVCLGFVGVATMIGPSIFSSLGAGALPQLACVTASLSYALAAVWARRFRRQNISPLSVTTGQLTASSLMMLPVSLVIDRPWTSVMPPVSALAAIAALALLCTAFGYVLYFRLIATSGATNALLVTLLVPPVAILLGGLFLGETLATQDFIGLGLIALGLAAIDGRLISLLSTPGRLRKEA
jgi:drug/metabolite transporter (DMT)-like permease